MLTVVEIFQNAVAVLVCTPTHLTIFCDFLAHIRYAGSGYAFEWRFMSVG